jgi:gliding motility-associated-like protein
VGSQNVPHVGADTVTVTFDSIGTGNYNVTITDSAGCSGTNVLVIPQSASDQIVSHADSATCAQNNDGRIVVTPLDLQNGPFSYSINGGAAQSDSIFTGLTPGIYQVLVTNSYGCGTTVTDTVLSPPAGIVYAVPHNVDTTAGVSFPLLAVDSNFHNPVFSWSPADGLSCTNCPNPTVTVNAPVTYYVTVSDSLNKACAATDSVVILIKGGFEMPDAFTPNGDGRNDLFGPVTGTSATIKAFRIYNRWGQMVHNANAYWDGKFKGEEQPAGTYIYYIETDYPDPSNPSVNKTGKKEGAVTLLR